MSQSNDYGRHLNHWTGFFISINLNNNQYTFAILIKDNLLCFIRTIKMITAFAFRILIYLLGFALAGY